MNIRQGTLFTDITELEPAPFAVDPAHQVKPERVVVGFDVRSGFPDDYAVLTEDRDVHTQSYVTAQPEFADSHEMLRRIIANVSDARRLEGFIKGGPDSYRIQRRASERGTTPLSVYNDASVRARESNDTAREEYEEWSLVGAAVILLMAPQHSLELEPPRFSDFKDRYWGTKAAERRRGKLNRQLKK